MGQRDSKVMPWLKWWDGTAGDMKLRMIAEQSGIPVASMLGIWAYMLEHASRNPERGTTGDVDVDLMAYTLQLPVETLETVRNGMKRAGLVTADGDIVKWDERQAKRERNDEPGSSTERVKRFREKQKALQNKDLHSDVTGNSDETDETPCNATKHPKRESKSKNKREPKPSSSSDDDGAPVKPFDRFWQAWPNKVAKAEAQKAWTSIKPDAELVETMLLAIEAQKLGADWRREDGQYIGHPASWLRGGRWLDVVRPYVEPVVRRATDAWWVSRDSMIAFGKTLTPPLEPNPGEYPQDFKARINAALERVGQVVAVPQRSEYVPPPPAGGESSLTPEQQRARRQELLALAGSRKVQQQDPGFPAAA